jgi:hypothetical protein
VKRIRRMKVEHDKSAAIERREKEGCGRMGKPSTLKSSKKDML